MARAFGFLASAENVSSISVVGNRPTTITVPFAVRSYSPSNKEVARIETVSDTVLRVTGQSTVRTIARNDHILASDVSGLDVRLDMAVGEGEWAVPVTFSDPSLVQFLQPGMEIAILGTSIMQEVIQKTDASEKPDVVEHRATSVVFPCVRILDIGKGDAIRRSEDIGANGTIIVALTPRQASTLVAAQRTMELYPALRKTNDKNALKRRDVGIVTEATFKGLRENLEAVTLPDTGN